MAEYPLHFAGAFDQLGGDRVDVAIGCAPGGSGRAGIYQDRSGSWLNEGTGGVFRWHAPTGAVFTATRISARLRNANGIVAQLFATEPGGGLTDLDHDAPRDGTLQQLNNYFRASPRTTIAARLACYGSPPCANGAAAPVAFTEVEGIEIEADDITRPEVSLGGPLVEGSGNWHSGDVEVTVQANDLGSGVWKFISVINGVASTIATADCPGDRGGFADRPRPCPAATSRQFTLATDRAPFADGANSVRFCVRDYANADPDDPVTGNLGCSSSQTVLVDASAPGPPANLTTIGGSGWRAENGFEIGWQPVEEGGSATAGVHYAIEEVAGPTVTSDQFVAGDRSRIGPLHMPRPGEYRVTAWLEDQAGNLGARASTLIRFDDLPPGGAGARPASGWISREELPYTQRLDPANPGGPSGIRGYAVSIDASPEAHPCGHDHSCADSEIDVRGDNLGFEIAGLAEGTHWVNAVAVSGAGLSSARVGSTPLFIDRSDPRARLSEIPADWVNHPVAIEVSVSDELSGMSRAPGHDDGVPITALRIDRDPSLTAEGSFISTTIANEGAHTIAYWARDLAGNINDGRTVAGQPPRNTPGQALLRIDLSGPELEFAASDASDPEVIRALVSDPLSGVADGVISFRRAGSGERFTDLDTTLTDGSLSARFPSDSLPEGPYELRTSANDQAGNMTTLVTRDDGEAMVIRNPVKAATVLRLGFPGLRRRSIDIGYGAAAQVEGRLTAIDGSAVGRAAVLLVESLGPGASRPTRMTTISTDRAGRFAARLRPGPGRRVTAVFGGTRTLAKARSAAPMSIEVHGRVRFTMAPATVHNGDAVDMRGSVSHRGARIPAAGKLVAIQYFDPARDRWRPVEVLATDARGAFTYRYRFRTISSAQRILFRAVALAEAGWPYEAAISPPRPVIVYP